MGWSQPLAGWTNLYELPVRQLRIFAHQTYNHGVTCARPP
jgi:hypothetical protein